MAHSRETQAIDGSPHVLKLLRFAAEHADYDNQLCGLGLQNFQSIREPAFLPIAPLTLLYGPNSAGKSSLGDALRFLHQLGSPASNFDVEAHLVRWGNWDRLCEERTRERFVGTSSSIRFFAALSAGTSGIDRASGSLDEAIFSACGMPLDNLTNGDNKAPTAVSIAFDTIRQKEIKPTAHTPLRCTEFSIWIGAEADGPLIRLTRDRNPDATDPAWMDMLVDAAHPGFEKLELGWDDTPAAALCSKDLRDLSESFDGRWLTFYDAWGPHLLDSPAHFDFFERQQWSDGNAAKVAASRYLRGFVPLAMAMVAGACAVVNVPPVRRVPTAAESTFTVLPASPDADLLKLTPKNGTDDEDPWYRLALDASFNVSGLRPTRTQEQIDTVFEREGVLDYVNRVVGDESMLGLGYRVVADAYPFGPGLTRKHYERRVYRDAYTDSGCLVHLYLRSEAGHDVEFEDVGSGVSQLIPVIVALHHRHTIIHQPELHLHPRLQSVLGDLFLGRTSRPLTIVESHSEHLLLRILRRIRETADLGEKLAPFRVRAEDVVVLYFQMNDDGVTQVTHLRINTFGEFLDRWPHGFFTERDEDLGLTDV